MTKPEVVCLCGSTRFYDEFQEWNYRLTMAGRIVLSVGFYPHAKAEHGHGEGVGHDSAEKVALDELHKRKIDLADRVLVLDVGGYIGESTRGEIAYAIKHGKWVDYLSDYEAGGPSPAVTRAQSPVDGATRVDDGTLLVYCAACGQWIEHFGDPAKTLFEHLGERHD